MESFNCQELNTQGIKQYLGDNKVFNIELYEFIKIKCVRILHKI